MATKQELLDQRYMRMARIWAENSYCKRRQVGALLVKNQMIISDGYNGTPSGFENNCEDDNNTSLPYVLLCQHVGGARCRRGCGILHHIQHGRCLIV